jgi:hypothetical protein
MFKLTIVLLVIGITAISSKASQTRASSTKTSSLPSSSAKRSPPPSSSSPTPMPPFNIPNLNVPIHVPAKIGGSLYLFSVTLSRANINMPSPFPFNFPPQEDNSSRPSSTGASNTTTPNYTQSGTRNSSSPNFNSTFSPFNNQNESNKNPLRPVDLNTKFVMLTLIEGFPYNVEVTVKKLNPTGRLGPL